MSEQACKVIAHRSEPPIESQATQRLEVLYNFDPKVGHAETPGLSQQPGLVEYVNPKQGYRIDRPSSWEQTSKAGADVLFADPAKKSTTIGVTVSPIKIAGLEQFGDVETVRKKLMNTEKQKVLEHMCTSVQTRLASSSCKF